jgi:hypothetical protein
MDSILIDSDVNKPLPSVIAIKSAENHLYNLFWISKREVQTPMGALPRLSPHKIDIIG